MLYYINDYLSIMVRLCIFCRVRSDHDWLVRDNLYPYNNDWFGICFICKNDILYDANLDWDHRISRNILKLDYWSEINLCEYDQFPHRSSYISTKEEAVIIHHKK